MLKIVLPLRVVPKCCDGVWECFRGIRGVSVGRLKMSEDLWRCLLVSLVSSVVFGCLGTYCGLSWWYLRMFELLGGVLGCF